MLTRVYLIFIALAAIVGLWIVFAGASWEAGRVILEIFGAIFIFQTVYNSVAENYLKKKEQKELSDKVDKYFRK